MKINCKTCDTEIPARNINLEKRLCVCEHCNEVFPLADFLTDKAEPIDRIPKPQYSKIESFVDHDSMGLIIPEGSISIFLLIFSAFWNGISWTAFFLALQQEDLFPKLFLIPFILIGIATAILFLFSWLGNFSFIIDKHRCLAVWSLFGFKRKKSCNTADIHDIVEEVLYTKNYQPVYGVSIKHGNNKSLKFGSDMTEDERKWCLGELRHFHRQYQERH